MNRLSQKVANLTRRKFRIRAKVSGTAERPRMSVYISNTHVSVQIVDDTTGKTLVHATTVGQKSLPTNLTERSTWTGTEIAKKAKAAKVTKVVLDRNGKLYHGRVKALAEAARAAGLEF